MSSIPTNSDEPQFLQVAADQLEDFPIPNKKLKGKQPTSPNPQPPQQQQQLDFHSPISRLRSESQDDDDTSDRIGRRESVEELSFEERFHLSKVAYRPRKEQSNQHASHHPTHSHLSHHRHSHHPHSISPNASLHQLSHGLQSANTSASYISSDEERAASIKHRLKLCGLSEALIDLMRPTVDKETLTAFFAHHDQTTPVAGAGVRVESSLNESEAHEMAKWLYSRVAILFRQMIRSANPAKHMKDVNALVLEHMPYIMPGTSEEVASYFVQSLEFNEAGRVGKDEFLQCWNRHARLIFPCSHHKSIDKGVAYCTIL